MPINQATIITIVADAYFIAYILTSLVLLVYILDLTNKLDGAYF